MRKIGDELPFGLRRCVDESHVRGDMFDPRRKDIDGRDLDARCEASVHVEIIVDGAIEGAVEVRRHNNEIHPQRPLESNRRERYDLQGLPRGRRHGTIPRGPREFSGRVQCRDQSSRAAQQHC